MANKAFEKIAGGRVIAFHAEYGKLFGVIAGLFLSQAAYYEKNINTSDKTEIADKDVDGNRTGAKHLYFWHRDSDWLNETAFNQNQLREAKNQLKVNGILFIQRFGFDGKNHYRVDFSRLEDLLNNPEKVVDFSKPKRFTDYSKLVKKSAKTNQKQTTEIAAAKPAQLETPLSTFEQEYLALNPGPVLFEHAWFENQKLDAKPTQSVITETNDVVLSEEYSFNQTNLDAKTVEIEIPEQKKTAKTRKSAKTTSTKNQTITPQQSEIRAGIKQFLAEKCFHAANENDLKLLPAKQVIQLNVVAANLEKNAITENDVKNWWNWFVGGGDFRGTKVQNAEKNGQKINTAPSVINETWLAFTNSKPTTTNNTDTNSADNKMESAPITFEMRLDIAEISSGIDFTREQYEQFKAAILTHYPTQKTQQEITEYESTSEYSERYA